MANIAVLYGSVRKERQGIKAARFIVNKLKERKHKVTFLDPVEYKLPLLKKMHKSYEKGKAPEILQKISKILKDSDGFVIVTGEYNHSVPPALKNMLDHFQKEYFFKPSAIVSYSAGSFGGVRASVHLTVIAQELGMPSIPTSMPIPKVQDAFDEDGNPKDDAYNKRVKKLLDEFEWYLEALKRQRERGTPY